MGRWSLDQHAVLRQDQSRSRGRPRCCTAAPARSGTSGDVGAEPSVRAAAAEEPRPGASRSDPALRQVDGRAQRRLVQGRADPGAQLNQWSVEDGLKKAEDEVNQILAQA